MTPEAEQYLVMAREDLREAEMIASLPLAKAAARSAFYAAFHAAEAFIFERAGKVVKTHSGVHGEFSRLLADSAASDKALTRTLGTGYGFKDFADYGSGRRRVVTDEEAAEMIAAAQHLVDRVAALLAAPHPGAKG